MNWITAVAFVLVALACGCQSFSTYEIEIEETAEKVTKGLKILELIKSDKVKDIIKKIKEIKEWAAPLASALGNIGKIIGSFIFDQESAELKYMKEQFGLVNNKLDALEFNFADIKDLLDWNTLKMLNEKHESNIRHLIQTFKIFVDAPAPIKDFLKQEFLVQFENQYKDAGAKLYDSFINTNHVLGKNIIGAIREYTKDHRVKTIKFMFSVSQLFIQAMELEVAYYSLMGYDFMSTKVEREWGQRLGVVQDKITEIDDDIMQGFENNYKSTLTELIIRNQQLSGSTLANFLREKLVDKFEWKNWFVVVSNDNGNSEDTFFGVNCDGYSRFNFYGKHIVVNHADPGEELNKQDASAVISKVGSTISRPSLSKNNAKYIFDLMGGKCNDNNRMILVVEAQEGMGLSVSDNNAAISTTDISLPLLKVRKYFKIVIGPN